MRRGRGTTFSRSGAFFPLNAWVDLAFLKQMHRPICRLARMDCCAESIRHKTVSSFFWGNELIFTLHDFIHTHYRDGSRAFVTGTFTEVCRFLSLSTIFKNVPHNQYA